MGLSHMVFPIYSISLLQELSLLKIYLHTQQIAFLIRSSRTRAGVKGFFKAAQRIVPCCQDRLLPVSIFCAFLRAKFCCPYLVVTYSKPSLTSRILFK